MFAYEGMCGKRVEYSIIIWCIVVIGLMSQQQLRSYKDGTLV